MKRILVMMVVVWSAGIAVVSGSEPLQISITPDLALFNRNVRIEGLSLSIWGENPQTALALGVVNGSTGDSAGLSLALVLNYAYNYSGIQWAPINYTRGEFLGWQNGLVNYAEGGMKGLQSGVVNYTGRLNGLQFGFLNYAASVDTGVQIGLVNFMPQNRWFERLPDELAPAMIFINWRL